MADALKVVLPELGKSPAVPNKGNQDPKGKKRLLEGGKLDILLKLIAEMKLQNSKRMFLRIMEIMLEFDNNQTYKNSLRTDVTLLFLEMLKDYKVDDYNGIFHDIDTIFMSKELKLITVDGSAVKQYSELGHGDFGMVILGDLTKSDDSTQTVAVKTGKDKFGGRVLLGEAKIMARLDHKNVVKLVAFQKDPPRLVMEHMELGNLKDVIESCNYTNKELLSSLQDVASGMEFISSKKYVHRDLYCKNVLVDSNRTCKIGDFGWARYVGYSSDGSFKEKGTPIIVYQTPIESIIGQVFSTKTDVWSFGFLVLELYHWAECLCDATMADTISRIRLALNLGVIKFPVPKLCPPKLLEYTMSKVLHKEPEHRPDFTAIRMKMCEVSPTEHVSHAEYMSPLPESNNACRVV